MGCGLMIPTMGYAALPQLQPADGEIGGHEYVDLGLPSGLLWATCNLGAETPFSNGDLYAWGEVESRATQDDFEAENYHYFRGYDDSRGHGKSIWTIVEDLGDNISATEYDTAAVKWGNGWRMPTASEMRELIDFAKGNPAISRTWHDEIAESVAESAKVGVRVVDGALVVTGAPQGAAVAVYDLAGRHVMASALKGHTVDLPALTPGVYIATVAGKSVRVRL